MRHERQQFEDMLGIAREIVRKAPEIAVHIAAPGSTADDVEGWKWSLPTLTVSFGSLGKFLPRRGPILQNKAVTKLDQYRGFVAQGIPTPHTERFEFKREYEQADFGKYVVLKPLPLNLTSTSQKLLLWETSRLHQLSRDVFEPDHFLLRAPAIVQRFIDTGCLPEYYRVLNLLGEPILWMRVKSAVAQIDFANQGAEDIQKAVVDPRSTYGTAERGFSELLEFQIPTDVADFSRLVNSAFPKIPLQACDIVREAATGQLFILEINAGGNTWDFSSRRVAASREMLGGREKLISLYQPWPKAAKALIKTTKELAC
jgi:hypothetical protein